MSGSSSDGPRLDDRSSSGDDPSVGDDRSSAGDDPSAGDEPRLQAGLEHLQRAAHEVIAATRALLDVAEELVDDPRTAAGVADLVASVRTMAADAARAAGRGGARGARPEGPSEGGDDDDPPVQRIPVS